ncbi:MAG: hypothetical protein N2255_08910, partial [Kiritimatiellae bacterium]|nr:hypothetical protein [Kiritimatiellia bacterium]
PSDGREAVPPILEQTPRTNLEEPHSCLTRTGRGALPCNRRTIRRSPLPKKQRTTGQPSIPGKGKRNRQLSLRHLFTVLILWTISFRDFSRADEPVISAEADRKLHWPDHSSPSRTELGITGGFCGGEAWYEIGGTIEGWRWSSKLTFPLDVTIVGACFGHWWYEPSGLPRWGIEVMALASVDNPRGLMTDTDCYPKSTIIGYTESRTRLEAWSLDACTSKSIRHFEAGRAGEGSLFLEAGMIWENFSYRVMGLRGFYRFPLPEGPVWLSEDEEVLHYRLDCGTMYAGLAARWRVARFWSLAGEVAAGGVYLRDEDHHLLREKLTRGWATGTAIRMGLAATFEPAGWQDMKRAGWFLTGTVETFAATGSGIQEQRFLDDSEPDAIRVGAEIGLQKTRMALAVGYCF